MAYILDVLKLSELNYTVRFTVSITISNLNSTVVKIRFVSREL